MDIMPCGHKKQSEHKPHRSAALRVGDALFITAVDSFSIHVKLPNGRVDG